MATADLEGGARQVFRASVDAVSVNVSVHDRNRPVGGLAAADFDLLDNGVQQDISSVSLESVPIDVTIVLDTSGSVAGAALARLGADVRQIQARLGPSDRLRLLTFSSRVKEEPDAQPSALPWLALPGSAGGSTAFFHAIVAAMLTEATPGRPHLVVALSDGGDNVSLLGARDVLELARRSDAVLHVLLRGRPGDRGTGWLPFGGPHDFGTLEDAASLTGGRFQREGLSSPATDLFRRALDEFKSSYVLWYTPSGVPRPGWHELTVRVKTGHYTVRARRGYFGG